MLYPTSTFALYRIVKDSEFLSALFGTYNDWLADFCSPFPKRLKGIALINTDDVHEGVVEMQRCAKMGLAGVATPIIPGVGKGVRLSGVRAPLGCGPGPGYAHILAWL